MTPTIEQLTDIVSRAHTLADAARLMDEAGIVHAGIEYVACGPVEIAFVNLGDTYATTIYCENPTDEDEPAKLCVGSWGGWYDDTEQEQNEEDGTITCGYCSTRTPMDQEDWHDVVCEWCGHHVDGSN